MRVPPDADIPDGKLTGYLLVPRPWDDKSGFLSQAGFVPENAALLREAIRGLAASTDPVRDGDNEYGEFWVVGGQIIGPQGTLAVTTVWLRWRVDGTFHFVTLKPSRRRR
jgi:hypothetical protein